MREVHELITSLRRNLGQHSASLGSEPDAKRGADIAAALAIDAGDLLTALQLRAYPVSDHADDRLEQVLITVHGVDVSVRGRETDLFVHVDSSERDEDAAEQFHLVVGVNESGENEYL